jgi:hypothetical protein
MSKGQPELRPKAATGITNAHVPMQWLESMAGSAVATDACTHQRSYIVQDGRGTPSSSETRSVKPIKKYRSQPRPSKASSCRQMILASMLVCPSKRFTEKTGVFGLAPPRTRCLIGADLVVACKVKDPGQESDEERGRGVVPLWVCQCHAGQS